MKKFLATLLCLVIIGNTFPCFAQKGYPISKRTESEFASFTKEIRQYLINFPKFDRTRKPSAKEISDRVILAQELQHLSTRLDYIYVMLLIEQAHGESKQYNIKSTNAIKITIEGCIMSAKKSKERNKQSLRSDKHNTIMYIRTKLVGYQLRAINMLEKIKGELPNKL